eukprot:1435700-Prymnesium_polylepis.2
MSQAVPTQGAPLLPHYAFMVEKSKGPSKGKSERLLILDFLNKMLRVYKKDQLHKEFPLCAAAAAAPAPSSRVRPRGGTGLRAARGPRGGPRRGRRARRVSTAA